ADLAEEHEGLRDVASPRRVALRAADVRQEDEGPGGAAPVAEFAVEREALLAKRARALVLAAAPGQGAGPEERLRPRRVVSGHAGQVGVPQRRQEPFLPLAVVAADVPE